MRRLRVLASVLVVAAMAAGCGGGGGGDSEDVDAAPTTAAAAVTTSRPVAPTTATSTVPAATLTLRMTDVRLVNSEESDNGVRVILPAGVASASVAITGSLPSPNRVISVCQANDLDRRMSAAACRMPASGEAVTVTLGSAATGIELVQVGVSGSGPSGANTTLDEVTIRYAASSREVTARLAQIAAGDAGGRPTFTLTPVGTTGTYRASLTWSVIQVFGGTESLGQLEVVQAGNVVNKAAGSGLNVPLTGEVPRPVAETAIRVLNGGASAMVSPKLTLLLP